MTFLTGFAAGGFFLGFAAGGFATGRPLVGRFGFGFGFGFGFAAGRFATGRFGRAGSLGRLFEVAFLVTFFETFVRLAAFFFATS